MTAAPCSAIARLPIPRAWAMIQCNALLQSSELIVPPKKRAKKLPCFSKLAIVPPRISFRFLFCIVCSGTLACSHTLSHYPSVIQPVQYLLTVSYSNAKIFLFFAIRTELNQSTAPKQVRDDIFITTSSLSIIGGHVGLSFRLISALHCEHFCIVYPCAFGTV